MGNWKRLEEEQYIALLRMTAVKEYWLELYSRKKAKARCEFALRRGLDVDVGERRFLPPHHPTTHHRDSSPASVPYLNGS